MVPSVTVRDDLRPPALFTHSFNKSAQTLFSTPITSKPRSSTVATLSSDNPSPSCSYNQLMSRITPAPSTPSESSSYRVGILLTPTQLGSSTTSTSTQSRSASASASSAQSRSDSCGTSQMNLQPKISISQVNAPSATTFNMLTSSLIQSPSISISQVNQQIPTSSSQQTMPASSSNPVLASPLAANALMTLISQVLSNCASPTPCTSGTASVIDPNHLFWVMILSGNISCCQGCSDKILRNSDGKPFPPPNDLVLQHKEQVLFNNPKTGMYQLSSDHRNVYYHARLSCVKQKFPSFNPGQHVRVNRDTFMKLTQVHKEYIFNEFGVKFSG